MPVKCLTVVVLWTRCGRVWFLFLSYVSSESLDEESVNTFSISPESTPQKRTDLRHHHNVTTTRWRHTVIPLERGGWLNQHGPTQESNLINLFAEFTSVCSCLLLQTLFTCFLEPFESKRSCLHWFHISIIRSYLVVTKCHPSRGFVHSCACLRREHAISRSYIIESMQAANLRKIPKPAWKPATHQRAGWPAMFLRTRSLSIDVVTSWSSNRLKKIEVIAPELPRIWCVVESVYSLRNVRSHRDPCDLKL